MSVIRKNETNWRKLLLGWAFLLPALCFIVFSSVIPTVYNFILSFWKWDGFLSNKWVGLANYVTFFYDANALRYLFNSIYLAVFSTAGAVVTGLFLAVLVYKARPKFGALARLVFFLPGMIPVAINGLLFSFILNPEMGLLNNFFKLIGLGTFANAWLEDSHTAMNCIIFVNIWMMCGTTLVLSYAAIVMLPKSLFESSKIDGAGYIKQLFCIVFPLIKNVIATATIFSLTGAFKTYSIVYVMTRGGPGDATSTIPISMLKTSFQFGDFGYAASMGVILSIVVIASILFTKKLFGGEQHEY